MQLSNYIFCEKQRKYTSVRYHRLITCAFLLDLIVSVKKLKTIICTASYTYTVARLARSYKETIYSVQ